MKIKQHEKTESVKGPYDKTIIHAIIYVANIRKHTIDYITNYIDKQSGGLGVDWPTMVWNVCSDSLKERAMEEVKEEILEEIKEEITVDNLHNFIPRVLLKRFGTFPKTLKNKLLSIRDSSTLSMLFDEATVCDGIPAFKKILNAAKQP
jgi:hypothetical protein